MTAPCCGCGLKTGARIVAGFQMGWALSSLFGAIYLVFAGGRTSELLIGTLIFCPPMFFLGFILYLGIKGNNLKKVNIALIGDVMMTIFLFLGVVHRLATAEIRLQEIPVVPICVYMTIVVFYYRREIKQESNNTATNPVV